MIFIAAAKWSWSWCRRATSRRGSRRPAPGWARCLPHRLRHAAGGRKETREIDGRHYVLEYPIKADFALIKAHQGDRWGNLVYRKAARNFGPIMATAAKTTIVEVSQLVRWATSTRKASSPRAFSSSASSRWKT
jgi:acyl CoA:acetate/3-ketoacid CoA transferase alpha subunit